MASDVSTDQSSRQPFDVTVAARDSDTVLKAVGRIVESFDRIARKWSAVTGWAPSVAADTLERARLDWSASLARTLALWVAEGVDEGPPDAQGRLILPWANLGALVEGAVRWIAAVNAEDYFADDAGCQ